VALIRFSWPSRQPDRKDAEPEASSGLVQAINAVT